MTRRFIRYGAMVALAVALVSSLPAGMAAQNAGGGQTQARSGNEPAAPTPRTSDGHPDLTGLWVRGGGGSNVSGPDPNAAITVLTKGRPCAPGQGECAPGVNFERDSGIQQRMTSNIPMYKPEFWEKVQYLDHNGNAEDPAFSCLPAGVPRMGPPAQIFQKGNQLAFLYQQQNTFRIVRFGPHDPINSVDQTPMGDSVAVWEGDTLVIDTVGFSDDTWLGWPGWFHSNNMHVIERMTRQGNTLTWQATVEDPDVLMKPWTMDARTLRLNTDSNAFLVPDLPCSERDLEHMVTKERG
jgi:hypothetical protein